MAESRWKTEWHLICGTQRYRLLLTVLLAILFLSSCVKIGRIGWHLLSARQHLRTIGILASQAQLGRLGSDGLTNLQNELRGAHADLVVLQTETSLILALCPHLGWLPIVGHDIQAAPSLMEMGLGITRAGVLAMQLFPNSGPDPPVLPGGETSDSSEVRTTKGILQRMIESLTDARPQLLAVQSELDDASRNRDGVDETDLSHTLSELLMRFDQYLPIARSAVQLALITPRLLGASGERSYLILAQNEDELRATGGFISGAGVLTLLSGEILGLAFEDSYAVDDLTKPHPSPPEPIRDHMGAEMWLFRDANWSPDFPTAAEVAATFYEQDRGQHVNGVIALDQRAIQSLVEVIGPVRVEGFEETVSGANFTKTIRRAWAPPEGGTSDQWWLQRKDFMSGITTELIRKLQEQPESVDMIALVYALQRALIEGHILIYLRDPDATKILAHNRWDGAILTTEGDYLMVVDTNMGFNKVNPNVQQSIDFRLSLEEEQATAHLTITYHNTSDRRHRNPTLGGDCIQEARYDETYEDMMHRCYWDYLRVYVPHTSLLLDATPNPLPLGSLYHRLGGASKESVHTGEPSVEAGDGGKDVFGTFFVLAPQESKQLHFTYELPSGIVRETRDLLTGQTQHFYSLLIQKQPGTLNTPIHVVFQLPLEARLIAAHPEPNLVENQSLHYWLELWTTTQLDVQFR